MKVSDWTERTACYKDNGNLVWIAKDFGKTMVREGVVWRVCKFLSKMNG
jgi:hypothetical protein